MTEADVILTPDQRVRVFISSTLGWPAVARKRFLASFGPRGACIVPGCRAVFAAVA